MEAGTSVSPLDTNGLYVNFTSAQLNSLYKFDIPNIPTVLQGTRAKLKIRVFDYLANTKDISYEFLIPKRGVSIKAQAEGSEKETRTKVKVVGENQFELQNMEEGGKTK